MSNSSCIIAAAGSGKRCNLNFNKILFKVDDKTILEHTLSIFIDIDCINELIIVVSHNDIGSITDILLNMRNNYIKDTNIDTLFMTSLNDTNHNDKLFLVDDNNPNKAFPTINNKIIKMVVGGSTRSKSIKNGLKYTREDNGIAIIHDGARPYTSKCDVVEAIEAAELYGASCVAKNVTDTLKYIQNNGEIVSLDRRNCVAVETPQCFKLELIKKAYNSLTDDDHFTDDTEIYSKYINNKIKFVFHTDNNNKITCLQDIYDFRNKLLYEGTNLNVTKKVLKDDELVIGEQPTEKEGLKKLCFELFSETLICNQNLKIGVGYDVHRLVPDRNLILGGVKIPHIKGLEGHSDADVLIHAVMDSILSAMGLRDIGYHFPDTDPEYKNISSILLLNKVIEMVEEGGYKICNISSTVLAEKPKLMNHIPQMIKNIAQSCHIDEKNISIMATTTEGLGIIGNEQGIAAIASCLLK